MNDQKAKQDDGKLKLTLVPRKVIEAIARVRMYGNSKYPEGGIDNWKMVEPERYRDALFRHLLAYLDDPYSIDEESGLPHLWHIACNVAFLCELEDVGNMLDSKSPEEYICKNGYFYKLCYPYEEEPELDDTEWHVKIL